MSKPIVGMIGLGLMGHAFGERLISCGHTVIGLDIDADKVVAAEKLGVQPARTPAEVIETTDLVLTSLTTTAALVDVVEGHSGLLSTTSPRAKVIVDLSTCEISTTQRLAQHLSDQSGLDLIDAPVSGGPPSARAGTCAIMAGGAEHAVANARSTMEQLGTFTHLGASGAGQATKLINQTLVLNNFVVIAEALRLAEAYGVDAQKVPEALASGYAGSNLLPVMLDRMARRDWTPTGYARQVLKDLEMVQAAGKQKQLAQPMTEQALTLFRMLCGSGRAELDGAAVLELLPAAPGDVPNQPKKA